VASTTDAILGLTSQEAARRLSQYGCNEVTEDQEHVVKRIARHFWAPVPWMLEATVVLQLFIGERIEAALIAALLIFNVALGAFQEGRANAALALLKRHLSLKARVRRDGRWVELPAALLVPDDVVQLSLAAIVPADTRIAEGSVLLDQSHGPRRDRRVAVLCDVVEQAPEVPPTVGEHERATHALRLGQLLVGDGAVDLKAPEKPARWRIACSPPRPGVSFTPPSRTFLA
jgi:hypothetical protein